MVLTFKSSTPETFEIRGIDSNGAVRTATATRYSRDQSWNLRLQHPSGRHWDASYSGPGILDALSELMTRKDSEYHQEKARGYRPEPPPRDVNVAIRETGEFGRAPVHATERYSVPPRRR